MQPTRLSCPFLPWQFQLGIHSHHWGRKLLIWLGCLEMQKPWVAKLFPADRWKLLPTLLGLGDGTKQASFSFCLLVPSSWWQRDPFSLETLYSCFWEAWLVGPSQQMERVHFLLFDSVQQRHAFLLSVQSTQNKGLLFSFKLGIRNMLVVETVSGKVIFFLLQHSTPTWYPRTQWY